MAIAGLIFGILSITVCWWLGITLGGFWAAGTAVGTAISGGGVAIVTWPVWVLGLGIGVGVPAVAIILSIVALAKKDQSKGIALAGLVTGAVAAVLGVVATIVSVLALDVAEAATNPTGNDTPAAELEKMQQALDDPAFQAQIMKAMEAAKLPAEAPPESAEEAEPK